MLIQLFPINEWQSKAFSSRSDFFPLDLHAEDVQLDGEATRLERPSGSHRVTSTEPGWSRPSGSSHCRWEPNLVCFPLWRTSPSSLYCLRLIGGPQTRRIINVESNYRQRWKKKETGTWLDNVGLKLLIKPRVKIKLNVGSRDTTASLKNWKFFVSFIFSLMRVVVLELQLSCHSARVCAAKEKLTTCPPGPVNTSENSTRERGIDRCRQLVRLED